MFKKINVAGFVNDSVVDGPGLRFTLFVQGCPLKCEGCHNAQAQSFEIKKEYTQEEIFALIENNPLLDGVTFSGGEPFCQAEALLPLARMVKQKGLDLAIYTGFVFEKFLNKTLPKPYLELASMADTIIDGPFILKEKEFGLKFKGSKNQRIIDPKQSFLQNKVVFQTNEEWF
ncbi:MAG: anaerobic ribonucleoside-triphosphate reductase activating protein [Christensenellales bacterium]|jgi:anaerobic ribonucleoside-triphosphate reductase activating protein